MAEKIKVDKKKSLIKDFNLTSLGWQLAVPIFSGAFLGNQIDRHTGSTFIFTLIFILIGIAIGYYSLIRHIELEMLRLKVVKRQNSQEGPPQ